MDKVKEVLKLLPGFAKWIADHEAYGWFILFLLLGLAVTIGYSQNTFETKNTKTIEEFGCTLNGMELDLKSLKDDNVVFTTEMVKFENRIDVMEGKLDLIIEMAKSK